jgi:hypothetical protein
MMLLADDERREQEFTVGESRPRLLFEVERFYTQIRARSTRDLCFCQTGLQRPQVYGFAMGIFNCR